MAAVLAPHNAALVSGYVVDRSGNDPFVWLNPFVWSHCHARSRSREFGLARKGPFVFGKDAVFFVSVHPKTGKLVCDCVFVIDKVLPIAQAEAHYPPTHPIRHYHFDQDRSRYHKNSRLTRVADADRSLVPHPPAPIGAWIQAHVHKRKLTVSSYFAMKKRRNVRIVQNDAQGIYDRVVAWCSKPGHQRLQVVPVQCLQQIAPESPADGDITW